MKKLTSNFVLLLLCLVHFNGFAAEPIGKVEHTTFDSKILAEQRELVVYLPAGYADLQQKFPVLYITDGDIQGPHTAGTIDFLAKFDQAPAMILVGIVTPGNQRMADLTLAKNDKPSAGVLGADRFLSVLETEIIPLIKSRYRTSDYQALAGTSHGGQFAINALIKRPQLFDGIIAISPSLYWNDQQMLGLAEAALKKQDLAGRLFLSIANEEPLMTGSFEQLIALTKKYQNPNLLISAKTFHDESHNSTTLLGQYDGLKHLFAGWAIPDKPQTLADLQAIFSARSKLLGETLQIPEDRANGYGQWLQYSNRQADAIELFRWNRKTYPQSFNTHTALIKAYLHFNLTKEAQAAVAEAKQTIKNLSTAQQAELKALVP